MAITENITKSLNTRIALKYDLLSNWQTSELILKKGEIAIAEIPSKTINNDSAQSQLLPPTVAMKVGDGSKTFMQLPWVQAVAGDVYAWAKKANAPKLSELTEIDKELADMVGDIIDSTDKIQDTDTFYKVGSEKDSDGKHKFVLHAYKKDGTTRDSAKDIEINWSDLDTWMAGEDSRVQGLITSAFSTLAALDVVNPDKKFVGGVTQVDGKIQVTKVDVEAGDIQGQLEQNQVEGLETLQSDVNTAKDQLANTDYGAKTAIGADNKLMTASAVQRDIENAVGALDDKIVVEQGAGDYVTSVVRNAETGAIVVSRANLTHDKITDWETEVTNKLAEKADKADFFYSDDSATTATNYIVRKNDIEELTHGLHFRGEVATNPTEWTNPGSNGGVSYVAGDIVILKDSSKEFLFDGTKWLEVGDENLYATKASLENLAKKHDDFEDQYGQDKAALEKAIEEAEANAVSTANENAVKAIEAALEPMDYSKPTAAETGKFMTSVTQVNGKITDASYANVTIADIATLQDHIDATNANFNAAIDANGVANGLSASNPLATKAYVDAVADAAAEAEVADLKADLNVAKASDAKFATSVTQTNGKIAVDYVNIYAADITDTVPLSKLTDGDNIGTVLNNIDGGVSALTTDNKLATKATVAAAVEAGVSQLDSELHAIAKTGNVNNLVQTAGEVLFFDCGTATTVI